MRTRGGRFGGRGACFSPPTPHPTINICIFFFYPACTYGGGRVKGGGGLCVSTVLRHEGTPKCPEMSPEWEQGSWGGTPKYPEMSPAQEVPGVGKIWAPRQPWGGWGRPWGHLGKGTFLGSPGDGDIPGVTWGGGRILPLLQGKSHSLGHFLKKTPTRESVRAPQKPTQDRDDPKISPLVPARPG